MALTTRPISFLKPALKDFQGFPHAAQIEVRRALTVAAEGAMADIAKALKGLG